DALEGLACPGVGHPALDHESADQADVRSDRGDSWRVGQTKADPEVWLALGRIEGHRIAPAVLGVAKQFIPTLLIRMGSVCCASPAHLDSGNGLAGLLVADHAADRPCHVHRLDNRLVDTLLLLRFHTDLQVARQNLQRPILDPRPLDLEMYQAVGTNARELETPVCPGGERLWLTRERPRPPARGIGRE